MYAFIHVCLLSVIASSGSMAAESSSKEESKNPFSKLPVGTELNGISVPSYDENLQLNAVFQATKVVKTSEEELQATDLNILHLKTAEMPRFTLQLKNSLVYPQARSLQENDFIKLTYGPSSIQGTAAVIHVDQQTGIIIGPVKSSIILDDFTSPKKKAQTRLSQEPKADMKNKSLKTLTSVVAATSIFTTYANGAPKGLSLSKQASLDAMMHTQAETLPPLEEKKKTAIKSLNDTSSEEYNTFIENHLTDAQKSQLIDTKKTTTPPTPVETQQKNKSALNIDSDGDSFYSAKSGILTYLTNVKVREPRLNLDCSKSLQVHMQSEEEKNKKKGNPFKKLVASGNVTFTGKQTDKQGKVTIVSGKAEIVEFDYQSETTILKGGKPSIKVTQGQTSIEQACKTDNQWILLEKDGSFRIEGGVETNIQGLDNLEKNK